MQAVIVTEKGKVSVKEIQKPTAGKDQILVKVRIIFSPPLIRITLSLTYAPL